MRASVLAVALGCLMLACLPASCARGNLPAQAGAGRQASGHGAGSSAASAPASARISGIVFCSDRGGYWRIWMIQPDGSRMEQLTRDPGDLADENCADVDPAVSPDGSNVLFTSTRGGRTAVWRMAIATGAMQRICDGDQAESSPDGKRIVFRRNEQIVTRDLASGREKILTPESYPHCSGPAWSLEGDAIAFACRWDGGNGVFLVPANGGQPQKVYDAKGACEPHWSPDGTRIAYETETNICTINPDGTKNRPVTYYGGVQRYARWSPDGKSLVFCQAATPSGPWKLYIVPSEGGEATRLTEGSSDMYPDWK